MSSQGAEKEVQDRIEELSVDFRSYHLHSCRVFVYTLRELQPGGNSVFYPTGISAYHNGGISVYHLGLGFCLRFLKVELSPVKQFHPYAKKGGSYFSGPNL
jgi:hypothetical protein